MRDVPRLASLAVFVVVATGPVRAETFELAVGPPGATVRVEPQRPDLVITDLETLRQHFAEVRDALPERPFLFAGQWVWAGEDGGMRTFADDPEQTPAFSPHASVVAVRPLRSYGEFGGYPLRVVRTADRGELWKGDVEGVPFAVTDDGRVLTYARGDSPTWCYDSHGGLVRRTREPQAGPMSARRYCAEADLYFVYGGGVVEAYATDGAELWRVDAGRDDRGFAPTAVWYLANEAMLAVARRLRDAATLDLLDPTSGEVREHRWQEAAAKTWRAVSPNGRWTALSSREDAGGMAIWDNVEDRQVWRTELTTDECVLENGPLACIRRSDQLGKHFTFLDEAGRERWHCAAWVHHKLVLAPWLGRLGDRVLLTVKAVEPMDDPVLAILSFRCAQPGQGP